MFKILSSDSFCGCGCGGELDLEFFVDSGFCDDYGSSDDCDSCDD
jgi:hypothetical protein